jgi:ABC-2 type transport system ATP-binding protein
MAERIGVIASGQLIAEGTLGELRHAAGGGEATLEEVFLTLTSEAAVLSSAA